MKGAGPGRRYETEKDALVAALVASNGALVLGAVTFGCSYNSFKLMVSRGGLTPLAKKLRLAKKALDNK